MLIGCIETKDCENTRLLEKERKEVTQMKVGQTNLTAHSNRYYFLMYIKTGDKKHLMHITPLELDKKVSLA